ncbi:hypothetical protein KXX06_002153, partial [Aspergillus fumigatus]
MFANPATTPDPPPTNVCSVASAEPPKHINPEPRSAAVAGLTAATSRFSFPISLQ